MLRPLIFTAALLFATAAPAQNPILAPVEKALERVTLGPLVGVAGVVSPSGAAALVSVGAGATIFDRYVVPNEACEARRRAERESLGADKVPIWGEVVSAVQQECRPKAEYWYPAYDFGGEVGLSAGALRGGFLRAWAAPLSWRWFTLGASLSVPWTSAGDGTLFGMRAGAEAAAHLRIVSGSWRPAASLFVRPEATVLERATFPDQVVFGARFVADL